MNNKGFTLIEVSIVIALIGFLLLCIGNILTDNLNTFTDNNNYYKYKLQSRYAMSKVVNEVKKNYGTTYDAGKVLSSSAEVLVNSNKNEAVGNLNFYYEPDKYGTGDGYGELRGADGRVIATNIKDLTIEGINENLIKVTIKAGKENRKRIFEFSTYVRLYD